MKKEEVVEDEFGMIQVNIEIDATIEAVSPFVQSVSYPILCLSSTGLQRMSKVLLKAAKEKRSSFVLKQVAKHEKYFEEHGISKDAPSLGQKQVQLARSLCCVLIH